MGSEMCIRDSTYTTSGAYTDTLTSVNGCDSIVTTSLSVTAQPSQPALACYETATFDTAACSWDISGTQDPSLH